MSATPTSSKLEQMNMVKRCSNKPLKHSTPVSVGNCQSEEISSSHLKLITPIENSVVKNVSEFTSELPKSRLSTGGSGATDCFFGSKEQNLCRTEGTNEEKSGACLPSGSHDGSSGRPLRRIKLLMDYKCLAGLKPNLSYDNGRNCKKRKISNDESAENDYGEGYQTSHNNCEVEQAKRNGFDVNLDSSCCEMQKVEQMCTDNSNEKNGAGENNDKSLLLQYLISDSVGKSGKQSVNEEINVDKSSADVNYSLVDKDNIESNIDMSENKVSKIKSAMGIDNISKVCAGPKVSQSSWNSRPYDNDNIAQLIEKIEERMRKTTANAGLLGVDIESSACSKSENLGSERSFSVSERFDNDGCSSIASFASNDENTIQDSSNLIVINDEDSNQNSSVKILGKWSRKKKTEQIAVNFQGKTYKKRENCDAVEQDGLALLQEIGKRKKRARKSLEMSLKKAFEKEATYDVGINKSKLSKSSEDVRDYYRCKRQPGYKKSSADPQLSFCNLVNEEISNGLANKCGSVESAQNRLLPELKQEKSLDVKTSVFKSEKLDDYLAKNHSRLPSSEEATMSEDSCVVDEIDGFSFMSFKSIKSLSQHIMKANGKQDDGKASQLKFKLTSPRKYQFGISSNIHTMKKKLWEKLKFSKSDFNLKLSSLKRMKSIMQFSQDSLSAMGLTFENRDTPSDKMVYERPVSKKRGIVILDDEAQPTKGKIYGRKRGRFASKADLRYHAKKKKVPTATLR